MPVKVKQYTLGGYPVELKAEEEFVKGRAGSYSFMIDKEGVVLVGGVNEKTKREWTAKYFSNRFWISVKEKESIWSWPVCIVEREPHFTKLPIVDSDAFRKAGGRGDADVYLSFEGVRDALKLYEKGKLKLAEEKEVERARAEMIKNILKYEREIREAAELFEEVKKLKEHPEVLKFIVREEKPVLTEGKAQILTAIDSLEKAGGRVNIRDVVEWLKRERGVEVGFESLIKMGMAIGELENEGYVKLSERGRVLTEFGRKELERYREKARSYVV